MVGFEKLQQRFWAYRGEEIAMIFEQPVSCLNPVLSIGEQLAEVPRRTVEMFVIITSQTIKLVIKSKQTKTSHNYF